MFSLSNPGASLKIRLWVFNNPIRGITDQLEFLIRSLKSKGYSVSIANQPAPDALNILIENLNEKTYQILKKFCNTTNKQIAVVMTEHIDFIDGRIYFHGLPFHTPTEYMHALTRRARLLHLLIAKNYLRCFIRLGDLPALLGLEEMFPGIPIVTLPFSPIPIENSTTHKNGNTTRDLVFTGAITAYRRQVLKDLEKHFNILISDRQVSKRRRDIINSQAKAVLNIPQDAEWKWVSSMRIMAAWRCGRPAINIGLGLNGILGKYCANVPANEQAYKTIIGIINNPVDSFLQQKAEYDRYILSESNGTFPSAHFGIWALAELEI